MSHPNGSVGADQDGGVEPVAVIGMAARVPGAADTTQFWSNLVDGVESVTTLSREEQLARGAGEDEVDDPGWVSTVPLVADHDQFDAGLFGMSAREAELMSPQHRMFLEVAHTALEDAGYDPHRAGSVGVYAGTGGNNYLWLNLARNRRIWDADSGGIGLSSGNSPSYVATSVSYRLNLRGPSLTLHTACSTSLVALHLAAEALRGGECDMALAGGVNIEHPPVGYVGVEGFTSPDGHCRPFDAGANGTVWGSGGGVVVVKRLADALADGDHVRAVILGNAINNDGADKVGFSAPSVDGQAEAVAQALGVAGVDPRTVTYVEAHGTGTALGDPIEVAALSSVYSQEVADRGWCGLGSVKSNIGHLSQAAGVVGVIKTVLALEHGLIPPSINVTRPNPEIDFADSPFYLATSLTKWDGDGGPRRAGVSSFGIGGTNAHVLLEQAPAREPATASRPVHLLPVSARSAAAADTAAERLADHLTEHPELDLADVSHTLRAGRDEYSHRIAVVATDPADTVAALRDRKRRLGRRRPEPATGPAVGLLLSGQGAQYPGMGAELYQVEPVFAATADECAELLEPELGRDLRELLFAAGDDAAEELRQTGLTQPALFTVEYALAVLWQHLGLEPAAMIGHSVGEYVAATLSGVFALPDALRLVAARGRLMGSMPPGAMLAVQRDESEVVDMLPEGVAVSAVNGPRACVVGGTNEAVEAFAETLRENGVGCTTLRTSHAFHSPMMDPILDEFTALVAGVPRQAPRRPFVSNVTGGWITDEQATDPAYWADHLRRPVRFGDCVATVLADGEWVLLECGPGRQAAGLARMQVPKNAVPPQFTLPGPGQKAGELATLYSAAGALWVAGVPLDRTALGGGGRRVPLPAYPFERRRYWVDPDPRDAAPARPTGPLPLDRWFAVPTWRELPVTTELAGFERCLAFVDGDSGAALVADLDAAGVEVVPVRPGERFARTAEGFTVRPGERDDYDALIADLADALPARLVHAWALAGDPAGTDVDAAWQALDGGFFSLLYLAQALAGAGRADGVHVDVVSTGTVDVLGDDLTRPEHATLAGIGRVLPLELSGLSVRHVDTDSPARVVRELLRPRDEAEVALRRGRRWVADHTQLSLPATETGVERDRGRYLITGGLGGIGITVAEDLARRVRARLVLTARTALPPREEWDEYLAVHGGDGRTGRAILAVRRMEQAGAEVLVVATDVTDPGQVRRLRSTVEEAYGGLDGIVHAAGVPGGGMAEVKERSAACDVLAPKVAGTLALAQVFSDVELDFVALCSSVTAVAGGFGQVDYCAANSFLDAYARSRHGWTGRVVSHNWGGWTEVGMAAEVSAPTALRAAGQAETTPLQHPVLTQCVRPDPSAAQCTGLVSPATHWMLDEHRIDGIPVVPGTAHLECARAAAEAALPRPQADGEMVVELRDVAFLEPLWVPVGELTQYRVELAAIETGADFQVTSRSAGNTRVHARGTFAWVDATPPPAVDVEAILGRCRAVDHSGGFGRVGTRLLTFGPRWAALAGHHVGESEEIALVEAPEAAEPDRAQWMLHPTLLDVATAFGLGPEPTGGSYLPLSYGRVTVRAPLPARFHSHLRYRPAAGDGLVVADVTLLDEAGRELVAISEFVLRRVDPTALAGPAAAQRNAPAVTHDGTGISPVDGAEALRRVLAADPGPQVVISPLAVSELMARVRATTADTVNTDDTATATRPDDDEFTPPRTELEATIARVWADGIGVDRVGADDDFFALGGNSLIAVQLVAAIRKAVGVKVPMRSLFETPTVAELAARVEELRAAGDGTADEGGTTIPKLER